MSPRIRMVGMYFAVVDVGWKRVGGGAQKEPRLTELPQIPHHFDPCAPGPSRCDFSRSSSSIDSQTALLSSAITRNGWRQK